jgi:galactoside O-acetyltransferase
MAYYSQTELSKLDLKKVGKNVLISKKASLYNPQNIEIGDNSRIDDFCVLSGKVTIGRNVHIAVFVNLAGGTQGITIDDFAGIAYGSHIFSQSDDYTGLALTGPTIPSKYKRETKEAIHIGRHCIVGANSVIFPGVHLAEGTSVGAMTLVTKSTLPWSIYFGIPARKVKERKQDLLELEHQYLEEEKSE